jgi:D-sedoheptulose 7-phosphate isomerase
MTYTEQYLAETTQIIQLLEPQFPTIEAMADELASLRYRNGRLFFIGNGGSAANASHAVNDFRKIADIEAYTPTDNVAELTARINDDGAPHVFANWLMVSKIATADMLFVLSVGGSSYAVSENIVRALQYVGEKVGCPILGIVGRNGGFTAQAADQCIIIPTVTPERITPHTESFQSVILHLLVTHPLLSL